MNVNDSEMLNVRIQILEDTLKCPQNDLSIDQLVTQLNILEATVSFYDDTENMMRIKKIKEEIENRMSSAYHHSDQSGDRMSVINERIDRVLQNTDFINRCVNQQGNFINQIELASGECLNNVQQACNELVIYRKYQNRRKKFLRVILILIILLITLIFIKIFI